MSTMPIPIDMLDAESGLAQGIGQILMGTKAEFVARRDNLSGRFEYVVATHGNAFSLNARDFEPGRHRSMRRVEFLIGGLRSPALLCAVSGIAALKRENATGA